MELTWEEKNELFERGFVKIPGVIPRAMVDGALRAINHSLGNGMNVEDVPRMRSQSYCPEIQRTPVIADLYNETPARLLAESVIGSEKIRPVTGGQIALRFPIATHPAPLAKPHLDGMYSPMNGVPAGTIQNFTALLGVMLSDLPYPDSGNLSVWPGTHRMFEQYFREHTPQSLLEGMPPIPMPDPEQITGEAGDIVIAHYMLAHGVTPNGSPNVRYAIYFRLTHVNHDMQKWESMTDIWQEWDGMHASQR